MNVENWIADLTFIALVSYIVAQELHVNCSTALTHELLIKFKLNAFSVSLVYSFVQLLAAAAAIATQSGQCSHFQQLSLHVIGVVRLARQQAAVDWLTLQCRGAFSAKCLSVVFNC